MAESPGTSSFSTAALRRRSAQESGVGACTKHPEDEVQSELHSKREGLAWESVSWLLYLPWLPWFTDVSAESPAANPTSWRSFENERLLACVKSSNITTIWGFFLGVVAMIPIYWTQRSGEEFAPLHVCMSSIASIVLYIVALRLKACPKGSSEERHLCILHQIIFRLYPYLTITVLNLLPSNDDIYIHRRFCLYYVFALYGPNYISYLPRRWQVSCVTFPAMCAWMFFNWQVGYWNASANFTGFVLHVCDHIFQSFTRDKDYSLFKVRECERHARLMSESLKDALRAMLSTTFDVSCECDDTGCLVTPCQQLENLIGLSPNSSLGWKLPEFGVTAAETQRISTFLSQTLAQQGKDEATYPVHRPALIETSLRYHETHTDHAKSELRVKMCCVALPTNCTVDGDSQHIQRLIVGLQELQPLEDRQATPKNCPPQQSTFDTESMGHSDAGISESALVNSNAHDADKYFGVFDVAGVHDSLHAFDNALSEHSLDMSSSMMSVPISKALTPKIETREVGIQADTLFNLEEFPVDDAKHSSARRRPPLPHKVSRIILNTSKCVMPHHKATPNQTIQQLVVETMLMMNPKGKGCCFWHIALQTLLRAMSKMSALECDPLKPREAGWQCKHCLVIHEDDAGVDDEDLCAFCHQEVDTSSEGDGYVQEGSSRSAADNEQP